MHITRGDTVQVISGDDKGKRGKVLQVFPKTGRVKIEGVNINTVHLRATQNQKADIVKREGAIHHSKVMLIDPKSGEPTRIRRRRDADGTTERVAVKSGQPIVRSR
ncbi:MAG TPA: 50S ribosomal protein L24 [Gemmatimonadales bacterium]|nr:50S ribosomal protein L24 [Gemmatimonadales bacterium]